MKPGRLYFVTKSAWGRLLGRRLYFATPTLCARDIDLTNGRIKYNYVRSAFIVEAKFHSRSAVGLYTAVSMSVRWFVGRIGNLHRLVVVLTRHTQIRKYSLCFVYNIPFIPVCSYCITFYQCSLLTSVVLVHSRPYYRQDLPQAALPVLFLLTGRFWVFRPASIKVKFGMEERTVGPLYGPLVRAKFRLDRFRGGGLRPPKLKKNRILPI